jgi:hypothetical protein
MSAESKHRDFAAENHARDIAVGRKILTDSDAAPAEVDQMSPAKIMGLKDKLRNSPHLRESVCAQLAIDLVLATEEFDGKRYPSPDTERKAFEDIAFVIGQSASSYAVGLEETLRAPGPDWLLRLPPSEFAGVVLEVEQRFADLNGGQQT